MNYAHISLFKQRDAAGVHLGGVEQFAAYLKRAIPELQIISWPDYPRWEQHPDLPDFEKAAILNHWLLEQGAIGKDTTVIVDGYWGMGLEKHNVGRLISVVHGTYYGRFLQHQIYWWGEVVGMDHVETQRYLWDASATEVVAVCQETQNELIKMGINKSRVIYHGVDLDTLKPLGYARRCWMHGAVGNRKGAEIVPIIENLSGIPIEPMSEHTGKLENKAMRLAAAHALVAPTYHEGNAYLLLEALACDVPLFTFATGLACEMDERCGFITDDMHPVAMANAIKNANLDRFKPREWAEEHASLEGFVDEWRKYLCNS
jgi:glycosyltransferase involved in cell wall biosynthesis